MGTKSPKEPKTTETESAKSQNNPKITKYI